MSTRKYNKRKPKKNKKRSRKKKNNKLILRLIVLLILVIVGSLIWVEYESTLRTHPVTVEKQRDIVAFSDLEIPRFISKKDEQIIRHTGFTVSYCEKHRIPYWVGYELTVHETVGKNSRNDRFVPDPMVKGICGNTNDYTRSGYDRGHMAPAADMKWSYDAMKESFYMSNICPQHPELNRRNWKKLEEHVRKWAVADSAIVIVCGPLFDTTCKRIGKNRITVPTGFFKVILSPYSSPPRAIGFLFKNEKSVGDLSQHAVTVDSVEKISGLDFFYQLPDSIENIIEASLNWHKY